MQCPSCRTENTAESKFCRVCATPLHRSGEPAVSFTKTIETETDGLPRGTVFAGRYEVIELLGAGGMGRVYRVHDTKLNEEVALKLIKPEIAAGRRTVERFRNEIKIARKITHRNVCRTHDLHEEGETLFLTMEFIRGEDLKSLIHRTRSLSVGTAVSIARQAAEGLGEAHNLGVVHRDLKPGNIMIDKEGQAKIMDFGIARIWQEKGVTGEGEIIGTPEYMSPEQVEGKPADARSDIYSLGIILFEMVMGFPPFEGETPFSVANKHKTEPPPVPKKLLPQIPETLNRLILRCLEKDRTRRYQKIDALVSDLVAIEQALPLTERALTRAQVKTRIAREITIKLTSRKLLFSAAVIIALLILGALIPRSLNKKEVIYPPPVDGSFIIVSFENRTGDRNYDTLRNVFPDILRTKFEQTGVRYVATSERMAELLKQAKKPNIGIVDSELGFELARRDGVSALVAGSYAQSGTTFVTTLRVLDVRTKTSMATASASGSGLESILTSQIDNLCGQIFTKLAFSQDQMVKASVPVSEYSTLSTEAYENFVLGKEQFFKWNLSEARSHYEKAIELDPNFASAYLFLSGVLSYRGESVKRLECLGKAYALKDRAPARERARIEAAHAFYQEGDLERGLALTEEMILKYPKDFQALWDLATKFRCYLGRYDESTAYYIRAMELDPSQRLRGQNEITWNYLWGRQYAKAQVYLEEAFPENSGFRHYAKGGLSFWTGKLDEAIRFFKEAKAYNPMPGISHLYPNYLHYAYALKEEWTEAIQQLADSITETTTPELKWMAHLLSAIHLSCLGMSKRAEKMIQDSQRLISESRRTAEEQFSHALGDWARFWIALDRADLLAGRRHIPLWPERASQMLFSKDFFKFITVWARGEMELREKNISHAKATLGEMESIQAEKRFYKMPFSSSGDIERVRYLLANFRAEVLLAEGAPDKAIAALAGIVPPEPPDFQNLQFLIIYLAPFLKDTLARAYEQLLQFDNAIGEYEKLLRVDPKLGPRGLPFPKYHYRLALLLEKKGDKARAAAEYRRFLELWKGAESDQPELERAKSRLAALGV